MKLILVSCLFALITLGCATVAHSNRAVARAAENYAIKEFGFKQPIVQSIKKTSSGYDVTVWDRPYVPGGFYFVYLTADLQLVDWQAGH
jgi:hypothetical protein